MFESGQLVLNAPFFIRFVINLVSLFVLVRWCYYPKSHNSNFLFSFYLFGIGVFIVTYLLHDVEMSMGFAFGLFAIFSMLRYRTESISIKEMTYLFLVIALALLSAVGQLNYWELLVINGIICLFSALAESRFFIPQLGEKVIQYEKIDNIKPENWEILLNDLKRRTGLNIQNIQVETIDFLKDAATIKVYYLTNPQKQIPRDIAQTDSVKIP